MCGVVFMPLSVPGVVRVCVGGGSDTFANVVHGEREQEVRLHLARPESGVLGGKARLCHCEVLTGTTRRGAT